ncbi:hypothetical protein [Aquirufa aurantiipilula]
MKRNPLKRNYSHNISMMSEHSQSLLATAYNSEFELSHDSYNALSLASNGKIYYILSSDSVESAGQMYEFDPKTNQIKHLADLNDICGESNQKHIPQGKSHVSFYEYQQKLYFSTHIGYYQVIDGMDRLPIEAPSGYTLYPGGHLLSYDLQTGIFEDLGILPNGEGCVSMVMDTVRGNLFGISWPTGKIFYFQLESRQLHLFPSVSGNGEAGIPGEDFRSLCRSLLVNPQTGIAYFSTSEGYIYQIDPNSLKVERIEDLHLRLDYFGKYEPKYPGNMAYNWRQIIWYEPEQVAYGVHGNSGYLFKFDPTHRSIELLDRITSLPSKKSGMFDQFSYGYLGFQLGQDGETLYYLTGGPIFIDGKRLEGEKEIAKGAAKGLENLHLITFHIPSQFYQDHGPIFYSDGNWPQYVNSIAIDFEGQVYALARVNRNNQVRCDLIQINSPFQKSK